jgi:hypothetical protein
VLGMPDTVSYSITFSIVWKLFSLFHFFSLFYSSESSRKRKNENLDTCYFLQSSLESLKCTQPELQKKVIFQKPLFLFRLVEVFNKLFLTSFLRTLAYWTAPERNHEYFYPKCAPENLTVCSTFFFLFSNNIITKNNDFLAMEILFFSQSQAQMIALFL